MVIKSKVEGLNDWLFIEEIPEVYTPSNPIHEKVIDIKQAPFNISNYQLTTGGLFLLHSNIAFDENRHIHTEVLGESITSQFIFYNPVAYRKKDIPYPFFSRHNIRYIPSYSHNYEINAGSEFTYFLLVLSKEYYFQLIDKNSLLHEDFVKDIEQGKYSSFATEDYTVTFEMKRVIQDLIDCKQKGELKKLHTESRILELLMYQMEQMQDDNQADKSSLKSSDIEKVELARTILNERYVSPPTLKELSREVLLNEFKLKKAFKEYLDTTVYDYITRVRMEKAKKLLLEKDLNVYEVSALVGFKHAPAFSSAFRKYYGVPPKEIK